jgi:tetratricopeptide (TPR) repeat protein
LNPRKAPLRGEKDRSNVEALKVLDELTAMSQWKDVSYYKAWIYTGLGQKEQALEWLEKAYDERSDLLVYLKVDPIFDSLRSEPRYGKLFQRMGLADKTAARDQAIHSVAARTDSRFTQILKHMALPP